MSGINLLKSGKQQESEKAYGDPVRGGSYTPADANETSYGDPVRERVNPDHAGGKGLSSTGKGLLSVAGLLPATVLGALSLHKRSALDEDDSSGNNAVDANNSEWLSFMDSPHGVSFAIGQAAPGMSEEESMEIRNVSGSQYDDELAGDNGDNILHGNGGQDFFSSSGGSDQIDGGAGEDGIQYWLEDGPISASLGGAGETGIVSKSDGSQDRINNIENIFGTAYGDDIRGNEFANTLQGARGHDTIYGYGGKDTLIGGKGNDELYGGDEADSLSGGEDHDTLHGGNGDDHINGGSGDDIIDGGQGNDVFIGDEGADTFVFRTGDGHDTIRDFEFGVDKIKLVGTGYEKYDHKDDAFNSGGGISYYGATDSNGDPTGMLVIKYADSDEITLTNLYGNEWLNLSHDDFILA